MIGHHFDNLYLYINKFPTLQNANGLFSSSFNTASFSNGASAYVDSFANVLLEQFGWTPISSFDSINITSTYLSGSNTIPEDRKLKTIWNRILQNLPIIYKTKGTEECVRLLSNIYGIPNSLLNVKEFGGNKVSAEDDSSYTFEKTYYLTKFNAETSEQLVLPSTTPLCGIEFKLKLDTNTIYPQNTPIKLARDYNGIWEIYLTKYVKDKYGSLTLDFFGNTLVIEDIPIFNGKIYNVLIKTIDTSNEFDSGEGFPRFFNFRVTCVEGDRIIFDSSKKQLFSATIANYFNTGSNIYFGNYATTYFCGNIDKINLWKSELSDDAFLDHCKNFDAYNDYVPSSSYSNLFFRYSIEYPENLYSSSNSVAVANANKYYSAYTASANNFNYTTVETVDCIPTSASVFPYQFDIVDINQNIKLNNVGPNKYKNTKIYKTTETAVARLMPNERSVISNSTRQDSNLIGVYVSPFKIRDDDMSNFIGNYDIMNEIGDPGQLYSNEYSGLKSLRNYYNTNNLSEKVLYQEFLTLYKNYFDGSFFETVKQLFPARAKIISGIIIEPSILERNKYQNRPIDSAIVMDLDPVMLDLKRIPSSINVEQLNVDITSSVPKNGQETISHTNNFTYNYISDDVSQKRNSIFSISGSFCDRDKTGSFANYIISKKTKLYKIIGSSYDMNKYLTEYNISLSGSSNVAEYTLDVETYPKSHYSFKTNPLSGFSVNSFEDRSISSSVFVKSKQTTYTTVNEKGILDGGSPVQITSVNREINQISLV